jgi:hypothetical protein
MPTNPELQHASSQIEAAIISFTRTRVQTNPIWLSAELHRYVNLYTSGASAPSSTDRILRKLRGEGKIRYEIINRSKSLYKVLAVSA